MGDKPPSLAKVSRMDNESGVRGIGKMPHMIQPRAQTLIIPKNFGIGHMDKRTSLSRTFLPRRKPEIIGIEFTRIRMIEPIATIS